MVRWLVVLLLCAVPLLLLLVLLPDGEEYCTATVHGSSMEPTLKDGDVVLWKPVKDPSSLRIGDIIIYRHPTVPDHPLIIHRIIEIENRDGRLKFRTKGDALQEADRYWLTENDIVGIVVLVGHHNSKP